MLANVLGIALALVIIGISPYLPTPWFEMSNGAGTSLLVAIGVK